VRQQAVDSVDVIVLKEGNMIRTSIFGAALLSASILQTASAQDGNIAPSNTAMAYNFISQQAPVQQTNAACPNCPSGGAAAIPDGTMGYGAVGYDASAGGGYPQRNMPLYPGPRQSTQPWTGGAIITNQAFAPHEMLYPHKYHAMYGPFYYRVKGCWLWTPFGMRQHEQWKLQGTEVKVNYRSTFAPFSGFHGRF